MNIRLYYITICLTGEDVGRDNLMNRCFRIIFMLLLVNTPRKKTCMILISLEIKDILFFSKYFIIKYEFYNLDNEYL